MDANVAVEREEPVLMNRQGNVYEENDAFGYTVTHGINGPDYILVMDEVVGNTSQKGDGHLGGELMLCEPGMTSVQTSTKRISTTPFLG